MTQEFRKQFRWQKFKLNYGYPDDFVLHQWQESSSVEGLFMMYRFFFLISFTTTSYFCLRQALWESGFVWKRTIYFSNWTLIMCWINSLLGCMLVIANYAFQYEQNTQSYLDDLPVLTKMYWASNIIALDCSISIVVIFWGTLVTFDAYMNLGSKIWHTLMGLYMFLDFWIHSIPVRILHYYIVFIYILIYVIFNIMYETVFFGTNLEGHHFIYSQINWKKDPLKAVFYVFMACLVALCVRLFLYGMHMLKNRLSKWVFNDERLPLEDGRSFASRDDSLSNLARL